MYNSSAIRQKGQSQNGYFKKNKARQILRKRIISYTYQWVRNICFLGNLGCFVFLLPPFSDSPFCLITGQLFRGGIVLEPIFQQREVGGGLLFQVGKGGAPWWVSALMRGREWGGVQEKFKDPPTTAWGNPAITPIYKAQ